MMRQELFNGTGPSNNSGELELDILPRLSLATPKHDPGSVYYPIASTDTTDPIEHNGERERTDGAADKFRCKASVECCV